jgi:RNA polymerase sigma factor (sigma-70 family)
VSATIDPIKVFASHQHDFEAVISRYSPVLLRVALRRLRNMEDAEDVVQDALLSAHKHIRQFEGRSQLSTWLTTIVTNAARMKIRGRSRHEMLSLDQDHDNDAAAFANEISEIKDARPNPETLYTQTEMNEILRRALAHLSPKLRSAIQLRELEGYSTREAASILGISGNALKSRVSRARTTLRLLIGNRVGMRPSVEPAPLVDSKGAVRRRGRSAMARSLQSPGRGPSQRLVSFCPTGFGIAASTRRRARIGTA